MRRKKTKELHINHFKKTLLGRLKLKWFSEFSADENALPSEALIKRTLLEKHRNNPSAGSLLIKLIGCSTTTVRRIDDLVFGFDVLALLKSLEHKPWDDARFLEIQGGKDKLSSDNGVFIYQEALEESGRVYVVTFFKEESFPTVSRMEIRACEKNSEPFLSVLTKSGYQPYSLINILEKWDDTDSEIKIALLSLHCLNEKQSHKKVRPEDAAKLSVGGNGLFPPPVDDRCSQLIKKVVKNNLGCTKIRLPLNAIEPADHDYCMLFPAGLIKPFLRELRFGEESEMLVYWNGSSFTMSDDYASYLAYRTLDISHVPVVVMGEYPISVYGSGEQGGKELLPNVAYRYFPSPDADPELRRKALDIRLQRELGRTSVDILYDFIFKVHRLLHNPLTKERELHKLLLQNSDIFSSAGIRVLSEVRFGNKFRADLVIQVANDNRRVLLVELERANLPLFTQTGAPYAHVTHALQQVEDWMRFWNEYPNEVPAPLDATITPAGVVVIGRSKFLSEDDKRRLLSLNSNRRIQLITYDDLISRVEQYVTTIYGDT